MNKTVLGINNIAKESYQNEYKARYTAFSNLLDFASKYSSIDIDAQRLYNAPTDYFMELMKEEHTKDFPSSLRLEKILDLLEIPMHVFHSLVNKFNSYTVELDVNSPEPIEKDWNIYAKNQKEEKLFKLLTYFCKNVDELNKETSVQFGALINGTCGAVDYNFTTGKLHPRISFIQTGGIRTNQ